MNREAATVTGFVGKHIDYQYYSSFYILNNTENRKNIKPAKTAVKLQPKYYSSIQLQWSQKEMR